MSDKRTQLEEVATEAVQRSGLHGLSFRTLADEVGVKSSSVHYYFPEKAHLAHALIEKYTREFTDRLSMIDEKYTSLQKKLEAFIKIFEDASKDDKLCLCGMMAAEVASLDERSRELLKEYFNTAETWLENALSQCGDQLASDIKPRILAKIIMSGLEGAMLLDHADESAGRLRAQRELLRSFLA